jgi:hypothetical protein
MDGPRLLVNSEEVKAVRFFLLCRWGPAVARLAVAGTRAESPAPLRGKGPQGAARGAAWVERWRRRARGRFAQPI